jgi:hypothetical protein
MRGARVGREMAIKRDEDSLGASASRQEGTEAPMWPISLTPIRHDARHQAGPRGAILCI